MHTIRLTIEYDGTAYHGWERRLEVPSVQAVMEEVLDHVLGRKTILFGASRTDAGVHARGQVAHFLTESPIPPDKWPFVLNAHLPRDIVVRQAASAPDDFHARFSSIGKRYRYTLFNEQQPSALFRDRSFHVYRPLDRERMHAAAALLVGPHDFAAFRDAGCSAETTTRTLHRVEVIDRAPFLEIHVEGNAFLYHMVRILCGTLIDIGTGRLDPHIPSVLFRNGDRKEAGQTAPACGLCLEEVLYPVSWP